MGGWLDKLKLRLTQPQVELEAWAELGKKRLLVLWFFMHSVDISRLVFIKLNVLFSCQVSPV